jgi:hypothetical protein
MCHTEGMSEQNQCILQVLAQVLSSLTGMWIIGADWNFTPGTLLKTNWLDLVKGVIVAPLAPTCHASVYDFFVVKQELAPSVVAVLRLDDAGLHPHWPSRLILRGDSRRRMIQTLVRPTKIPGVLPFGPPIRPISYTCHGDHKNLTHGLQIALDAKMEHWYHVARRELRGVCTSTANKLVKAKLQYVNAVGKLAEPQPGASWQSHTWQALGRRFTEVLRVGNRGDDYSTALTHTHLKKSWLSIAVAWKDGPLSHTLTAWMDAATTATANHDTVALGSLIRTAISNGKLADKLACEANARDWVSWATHGQKKRSGGTLPTRRAFQWFRCPAGWTKAIIGTAQEEAATPLNPTVITLSTTTSQRSTLMTTRLYVFGFPPRPPLSACRRKSNGRPTIGLRSG